MIPMLLAATNLQFIHDHRDCQCLPANICMYIYTYIYTDPLFKPTFNTTIFFKEMLGDLLS